MKRKIETGGLDDFVESISAGTDVDKKGSKLKYPDGLHPAVRTEVEKLNALNEHDLPLQLDESLVTPNTIAVLLNNTKKTPRKLKNKCYFVINGSIKDPGNIKTDDLRSPLNDISYMAYGFCNTALWIVRTSIQQDRMPIFEGDQANMHEYMLLAMDFV
jgi:hypothetical protein